MVGTIDVAVTGVADSPTLTVTDAVPAYEDRSQPVDISQATIDAAVPGTTVTISGVPAGATLSSGTDNGDGSWAVPSDELSGLMVTPASGSSDDMSLTVSVTGNSTVLSVSFDSDSEGFTYADDGFRATANPAYAEGAYDGAGGETGGGLTVDLGGTDSADILGMSGGWQTTFNVPVDATGTLTFKFRMIMDSGYEPDE